MGDDSASVAPDDDVSVGNRLKQARVDKGLALEQAAEELRLSPDVLSALEADQFDILGAQVFVRGHLRQYAQLLGLDADDVMQAYSVDDHPNDDPIVGLQPIRVRDGGDLRVWLSLGGVVLVMVALLIWWLASPDGDTAVSVIGPTTSSLESAPPPVVQAPVREPETADEDTTPVEMAAAGSALADTPAAPIASVVDVVADETELPVAGTFSVEITFDEDCWVEIIGGDDRRLFYGLGRAGARSRFEASSPMSVLLGNVDGVRIAINGAAYPAPVGSRQGNLARFVVVAP
jgi:cytoskeleton protein RodZ